MNAIKLLRLEWSKWSSNSVFRSLMLTYFILSPLLIFMGKMLNELPALPSPKIFFQFPHVWDYLAYSGSWLAFFCLGYFGVFMITSEFGWKTLRQSVINGQTRFELLKGKVLFILILAVICTFYYILAASLIGIYHADNFSLDSLMETQLAPVRYFLMVLGYMIFGLMTGLLVRRSGLALFTYFSYILIGEKLLRWVVHFKIFGGNSHYYYPLNVISDLTPLPIVKLVEGVKVTSGESDESLYLLDSGEAILFSLGYIIIFTLIAWFFLRKRDL